MSFTYQLGQYVTVPVMRRQGSVVSRTDRVFGETEYLVTWLGNGGVQLSKTFTQGALEEANKPEPVVATVNDPAKPQPEEAANDARTRELARASKKPAAVAARLRRNVVETKPRKGWRTFKPATRKRKR